MTTQKITRVRYCSTTNSTLFCQACDCAVMDSESNCPGCKREVFPASPAERHREALRQQLGPSEYSKHVARVNRLIADDRKGICRGD